MSRTTSKAVVQDESANLPVVTIPMRTSPEIFRLLTDRLQSVPSKQRPAAKEAILEVYTSGAQMPAEHWAQAFNKAIDQAIEK